MNEQINTPITEQQFNQICEQIESSQTGLLQCCKSAHISQQSFYQYIKKIGDSAKERYARAKESQIDNLVDQMEVLENACLTAVETAEDSRIANAIVQAYRLKIDNLKWIASKLKPKTYGDKLDITSNGNDITREILITPISNTSKPTATSQDSQAQ